MRQPRLTALPTRVACWVAWHAMESQWSTAHLGAECHFAEHSPLAAGEPVIHSAEVVMEDIDLQNFRIKHHSCTRQMLESKLEQSSERGAPITSNHG